MRTFVTGGTGYVGGAIVDAFVRAGHEVIGLARSEARAALLRARGASAVAGELTRPESFAPAAAGSDAVIHVAQDAEAPDRRAADVATVDALLAALERGAAPAVFIYTSNAFVLGDQGEGPLGEDDPWPRSPQFAAWRVEVERHVLAAAAGRVATAVIRPGQVFGGDGGTLPLFFESAGRDGVVSFVGDGANRWSMIHRDDLARLYLAVAERRARGIFHGTDGTPVRVGELARSVSEATAAGGLTRAMPLEEARREYAAFADMLALDVAAEPRRSRALGWLPTSPTFPDAAVGAYREWRQARGA